MRQLTKVDVILHKVGINTRCFIYWSKPKVEEVDKQLAYNQLVAKYRRKCVVNYPGAIYDLTGEFDMYLNQGMSPYDAWHEVMVEFVWK